MKISEKYRAKALHCEKLGCAATDGATSPSNGTLWLTERRKTAAWITTLDVARTSAGAFALPGVSTSPQRPVDPPPAPRGRDRPDRFHYAQPCALREAKAPDLQRVAQFERPIFRLKISTIRLQIEYFRSSKINFRGPNQISKAVL
jgi:hypothetical protein